MSVARHKEMFEQMVLKKDPDLISEFYSPEFELHTNGQKQTYEEFLAGHERVYATEITYRVEYDEDSWVEQGDRVAGRLWITTSRPDQEETRIEVTLIAHFAGDRISRITETTWPDWRELKELGQY